jgi:hypothetical protein
VKRAGTIAAGLLSVVLAHHAALLPHEYAHSFMAWALGYKSDPLVIHWGVRRATDVSAACRRTARARGSGFPTRAAQPIVGAISKHYQALWRKRRKPPETSRVTDGSAMHGFLIVISLRLQKAAAHARSLQQPERHQIERAVGEARAREAHKRRS